jgi:hypothetical protein
MLYWKLCGYFTAFSINNLSLLVVLWVYGWGPVYAWVYSLTSIPIFLSMMGICSECLRSRKYRARAVTIGFILAVTIGHLTHAGIVRPVTAYDWISLTEGTLLLWAGTMIGVSAAYAERSDLALILSILWLAQALFSFGYVLHLNWPMWMELNWWLPETICMTGFILIGIRLRCNNGNKSHPASYTSS